MSGRTTISRSADPVYKELFTLKCQTTVPSQSMERLRPYIDTIDIVWSGPANVISQLHSNQSIIVETDHDSFTSSLTFLSLNTSHNGDYSCRAIARLPNNRDVVIGQSSSTSILVEG